MIQAYTPANYEMLSQWWTAHEWAPVPPTSLPTTGYISYVGGNPILAGFLYIPQSGDIGWVEWVVSNPVATFEERTEAFIELVEHINQVARNAGLNSLITSGDNQKYLKRMEYFGYLPISHNITHLWKILCQP